MSTYEEFGVKDEAAESLVKWLRPVAERSHNASVLSGIGGFYGAVRAGSSTLVCSTDGVGTKSLLAQRVGDYSGLGQDLVAVVTNDLCLGGAKPVLFMDYLSVNSLDEVVLKRVLAGVGESCEALHLPWVGGETAQMPDLIRPDCFDLAGFAVGLQPVSRGCVSCGDQLIAVPSSGPHANGYSLIRGLFSNRELSETYGDQTLASLLLQPTALYAPLLQEHHRLIQAAAHVSGGGIVANLKRVLPGHLEPRLSPWAWPEVFEVIATKGVANDEMERVFNLGVGLVLVVKSKDVSAVLPATGGFVLGDLTERG